MSLRSQHGGRNRYSPDSLEKFKDAFTLECIAPKNKTTLEIKNFPADLNLEPGIFIIGISIYPEDMLFAIRCVIDHFFGLPDAPDVRLYIATKAFLKEKLHKSCMQIQINFTREAEKNLDAIVKSLERLTNSLVLKNIGYDVNPAITEDNIEQVNESGTEADKKAVREKNFVKGVSFEKKINTTNIRFYYLSRVQNLALEYDIFADSDVKRLKEEQLKRDQQQAAKKGYERSNLYAEAAALGVDLSLVESSISGSREVQAFIEEQQSNIEPTV